MPTPEEWRQQLERIQAFNRSVKGMQSDSLEGEDEYIHEDDYDQPVGSVRETMENPDDTSMRVIATSLLLQLDALSPSSELRTTFLAAWIKAFVVTVIEAYKKAGD